ncbi:MAG: peptidylprolyl isomerase [Thermoplasmata archaeon]|nr:MAG: peptidylprolyl isomerase [Thermoplasmata archaeon]
MSIKKGDIIRVEFEGRFDDGVVFDSSKINGEPLEFEVGIGYMLPGFEKAVIGMENGEEKEFKIKPEDAYGEHNPQLILKAPRERVPEHIRPGMILITTLPAGMQIPVKILDVTEQWITVDINHPLAGKVLNFKVKIVDIAS